MPFVVPAYHVWEAPYFGLGLKAYSLLAGKRTFGASRILSRKETLERTPNVRQEGLRAGVLYYDGQFDDARFLIDLAFTAAAQGATLLNYAPVEAIEKNARGFVTGVVARDSETGAEIVAPARAVINATGPFCDAVRNLADPGATPMVAPSQGIHLVVAGSFLGDKSALVVPRTPDGRVMFAIPWHGHTVLGTTDTPISTADAEPVALDSEVTFVLETAARYLQRAPTRQDVLSVFAGIRPLVRAGGGKSTAALARDHTIYKDASGLLTITGGKWTTYRHMAESCVDTAIPVAGLPFRPCVTENLPIRGGESETISSGNPSYPPLDIPLHPELPYTGLDVVRAVRLEMARTLEDVLARRTRALFLRARAAQAMAPVTAEIMAGELSWSRDRVAAELSRFQSISDNYILDKI